MARGMFSVVTEIVLVLRQTVVTGTVVHGLTTTTKRGANRFHYGVIGSPGSLVQ